MAIRSCSEFPIKNPNFIGIVIALLLVFFLYVYEFFVREGKDLHIAWLIITSFFYVMSVWSYVVVTITDPGRVPLLWGLYNQNPTQRKFCLICHNFKPERCHHCSKCRQCVLNMDHHCPWINNCVGFFNRKYFLLFIFYLLLALITAIIQMVIIQISEIADIVKSQRSTNFHTFLRIATLITCLGLFVTLFMFFHMHVSMVFENTTTLEMMVRDRKRKSMEGEEAYLTEKIDENQYDIGPWYNFTQVFGENIFYWFVPLEEEFMLKGKGIFWEKKTLTRDASLGSGIDTQQLTKQNNKHNYGMYNF